MQNSAFDTRADVLVIGAGLAGLRAAIAARQTAPDATVLLATLKPTAHGSSFFNIHNRLGIQVCLNEKEKARFYREAIALAPPGKIDETLVRIMADESQKAFSWLKEAGGKTKTGGDGKPIRVHGCFSPHQRRAFLIEDVKSLFYTLTQNAKSSGISIRTGLQARELLATTSRNGSPKVSGALFRDMETEEKRNIRIHSDVTILACGGQTALLTPHISGAGKSSLYLHNWCIKKKLAYINNDFTQFVWCRAGDFSNWNISQLAHKDARYKDTRGRVQSVPENILPLFRSRATHAPVSYSLKDRIIDELLMENLNLQRQFPVFHPDTGWLKVTLAAQASNGGIRIDENGFTGFEGLYACGECAGGMHGADRIGGAMVLSCLVFGRRAGIEAARQIKNKDFPEDTDTL